MKYDVIVIGGGHAGVEAAHISAKMNKKALLITSHLDLIGQMSCNPAIGGIAKGTIVREIDALGGVMGSAADACGIHFRMLNRSKGMAVWGNRAQIDKRRYRNHVRSLLESRVGLDIIQGFVVGLNVLGDTIDSVVMESGEKIKTGSVVLAMGTFLNGLCHIGLHSFSGGRLGEPPSISLTQSIEGFGIKSGRLKTGTSPRIDGRTIDFSEMTRQDGDPDPWPFSFSGKSIPINQTSCWMTKTVEKTHDIIKNNLHRSPLYTGKISSIGPRYCPSIEDKVVRFGERTGHTLFLEPEGLDTYEYYLNGLSSSLPFDVQQEMVRSVSGLNRAHILRPGYGIEYDYFQPLQLFNTLESKFVKRLFFAGQINGTSGYEEAACQGLVAGINAVESLNGGFPFVLGRETSYIGVLIDDLITKGTEEPYRMFTARAEYRLQLRQDNADERLMPIAYERGLIDDSFWQAQQKAWDRKRTAIAQLGEISISPQQWTEIGLGEINQPQRANELLRRPEVELKAIERIIGDLCGNDVLRASVEADVKYSGFIQKQNRFFERQQGLESMVVPEDIEFGQVHGLSTESQIKFSKVRPRSIAQASRIPGVTPADISVLINYLKTTKHVLPKEPRENE